MTTKEAAELVIQAGAMGTGGDVFILDMGKPVKIFDLAKSLIRLNGLTPYIVDQTQGLSIEGGDIPIRVTGLRKGEKLHEELLLGNNPLETQHPRIMSAKEISVPIQELKIELDELLVSCKNFDIPKILEALFRLPLQYRPSSNESSDLIWQEDFKNKKRT